MPETKTQTYANHKRYVTMYHVVLFFVLFLSLIGGIINFVKSVDAHYGRLAAALIPALAFAGLIQWWYSRAFAARVQDRAIRAEEKLRHFTLTGKPLDHRLSIAQIIALRFASDEEFLTLAKRAAEENMKNDDIKKAIKTWKADHHRA